MSKRGVVRMADRSDMTSAIFNRVSIGLIRKIPTLKPINLGIGKFMHLVTSTQLRNAENFNLISSVV